MSAKLEGLKMREQWLFLSPFIQKIEFIIFAIDFVT